MPFRSAAQRRFMYSRHPDIAERWRKESGPQRGLPERAPRGGKQRDQLVRQLVAGRKMEKHRGRQKRR